MSQEIRNGDGRLAGHRTAIHGLDASRSLQSRLRQRRSSSFLRRRKTDRRSDLRKGGHGPRQHLGDRHRGLRCGYGRGRNGRDDIGRQEKPGLKQFKPIFALASCVTGGVALLRCRLPPRLGMFVRMLVHIASCNEWRLSGENFRAHYGNTSGISTRPKHLGIIIFRRETLCLIDPNSEQTPHECWLFCAHGLAFECGHCGADARAMDILYMAGEKFIDG